MSDKIFKTPVAFIIFNRASTTSKVFEVIRKVKPVKLLIIADGPRVDNPLDVVGCNRVRDIVDNVDWDCEVLKNYSDFNLGCGLRPATGLDWVFDHVDEAIILEDDCLPTPSFFRYCEELLEKYRNDERVMHISGSNTYFGEISSKESYYFSRYPFCWGWATWRRAWSTYDYDIKMWPDIKETGDWSYYFDSSEDAAVQFWKKIFDQTYNTDKSHLWDFQWILSCWRNQGLSIIPKNNLVSNIGFGTHATHTRNPYEDILINIQRQFNTAINETNRSRSHAKELMLKVFNSRYSNMQTEELSFPLHHPVEVSRNREIDKYFQFHNYQGGYLGRFKRYIKALIGHNRR